MKYMIQNSIKYLGKEKKKESRDMIQCACV